MPRADPNQTLGQLAKRLALPTLFVVVVSTPYLLDREAAAPASPATPADEPAKLDGAALGTTWSVTLTAGADQAATAEARVVIDAALDKVDGQMSTWRPDSELSRFNVHATSEPFAVSDEHRTVLARAQSIHGESRGAFDVTVRPLVRRWGFGAGSLTGAPPPDEVELAELIDYVGTTHLTLGPDGLEKDDPRVEVDLSAIAKGFAVDLVSDSLLQLGHRDHMVEVGGEIRVRGDGPAGPHWRLAIERPTESAMEGRSVQTVVRLRDSALATSGDYRDYREVDGQRISHTIDPRTGHPITHALASVSVIAPDCMSADAWATALSVLGPEEGLDVADEHGVRALMLIRQGDDFVERSSASWPASAGE